MTHYILIDETTRKPVPLPFHTTDILGCPVTVTGFENGGLTIKDEDNPESDWCEPWQVGLVIITEEEFMQGQQP